MYLIGRIRTHLRTFRRAHRRDFLLRMLAQNAVGAEIGVWKGEFSRLLLERTRPRELHLIDPWMFRPELPARLYGGREARSQADMDGIHSQVVEALGAHDAVRIHRKRSEDAVRDFPGEYFDWIYLDADHSYEAVRRDLELFLPKVKPGGWIAGDDYRRDVKRAVDELAANGRARLAASKRSQFVLRKPG